MLDPALKGEGEYLQDREKESTPTECYRVTLSDQVCGEDTEYVDPEKCPQGERAIDMSADLVFQDRAYDDWPSDRGLIDGKMESGKPVVKAEAPGGVTGNCIVSIEIADKKRALVGTTEPKGKTKVACKLADKVADRIDTELPTG